MALLVNQTGSAAEATELPRVPEALISSSYLALSELQPAERLDAY